MYNDHAGELVASGKGPDRQSAPTETGSEWIGQLTDHGVAISMDGRGRAFDNIFTERLWRSVKYEEVYLKDYDIMGLPHLSGPPGPLANSS